MRTKWLFAAVWLVLGAVLLGWLLRASSGPTASADTSGPAAHLPIVLKPAGTPTPDPTPTVTPGPTREPPPGGNWIANGSFEDGWTDLPPAPGNLINQNPNGWVLTLLEPGTLLWDDDVARSGGVPESLHKLNEQLPPNEQLGGPHALILDGDKVYKTFHAIAPFGAQLYQLVGNLPEGAWRLTVPVQVHTRNDPDPWSSESGAWVLQGGAQAGGWANAEVMGDHQWFEHVVEFETPPGGGVVEVVLRFKSKWNGRDFFIDAITLERIDAVAAGRHRQFSPGRVLWLSRPLSLIPADELVRVEQ